MTSPLKIVTALVKVSLWVGIAGGLGDMTLSLARKSGDASRHGLVGLTDLNRVLFPGK